MEIKELRGKVLNIKVRNNNSHGVDIRSAKQLLKSPLGVTQRLIYICVSERWLIASVRNT